MNEPVSKFWLVCEDNVCHCDWRFSIVDCDEEYYARIFYIVTGVTSGVLAIIAVGLLYFRLNYRNQRIFDVRNGFPRPKPIECMGVWGIVFNVLQMIHAIIMVTDAIPNPIFRSFFFEFPFLFGYCAIASYLFGVAYTLSDSSYGIFKSWVRSQKLVNALCVLTIIMPFLTNISLPIVSGYHASIGNIEYANTITTAQYYIWMFYTLYLGSLLLAAGIKLLQLLDKHLLVQTDLRKNITKFKTGALKVKIIVLVGTSVLWIFAFLLAMYSICRTAILKTTGLNMVVLAIWEFAGVIATFFVEIAILINPEIAAQLSYLSFGTSSEFTSQDHSKSGGSRKLTSLELGTRLSSQRTRSNSRASIFMFSPTTTEINIDDKTTEYSNPQETVSATLSKVEEEQIAYNSTVSKVRVPSQNVK